MKRENLSTGFYVLAIAIVLLTYNSLYAFAYFPITEGWFSEYAMLIRQGAIPHRDFHLLLSPFYSLIIAIVQSLFGEGYFPLRFVGLGIIAGIGISLYFLLRKYLGSPAAAFASLSATIYYQSGNAFLGYDFTQVLTLFLLLGALSTLAAISRQPYSANLGRLALFFGGGLFFGCAVLIKHSNGGVATLLFTTFSLMIGLRVMPGRDLARSCLSSFMGFLAPFLLIVGWIAVEDGFSGMMHDLFIDAAAAKGGVVAILTKWIDGLFGEGYLYWSQNGVLSLSRLIFACLIFAVPFVLTNVLKTIRRIHWRIDCEAIVSDLKIAQTRQTDDLHLSIAITVFFLASIANVFFSWHWCWEQVVHIYRATDPILLLTSFNFCFYGLFLLIPFVLVNPNERSIQLTLLLAFGLALFFGNGTSAGLSEISAFFGYALIVGLIFRAALPWRMAVFPLVLFGLAFSSALMEKRYHEPYRWWSVVANDVRYSECSRLGGVFDGVCLEKDQARKIQKIQQLIQSYTSKGDEVFVYPHMPVFYLMTERRPFKGAVVSWFDLMSDKQAEELAESLERTPPKLLIYALLPEEVAAAHERLFRGGAPSGQRKIVKALQVLERNGIRCRMDDITGLNGLDIAVLVPCHRPS